MQKEVLIRRPDSRNNTNQLIRCQVLSEAGGKMRCKCDGDPKIKEVSASETIPVATVTGQARPGSIIKPVAKAYPESPHALGNRFNY